MSDIDEKYQQVVDGLAIEFLRRSREELIEQPDYGSIVRKLNGNEVSVAFSHYRLKENVDHIVFIIGRPLLIPIFYRKFINGVVFGSTGVPRLMTDEEAAAYD